MNDELPKSPLRESPNGGEMPSVGGSVEPKSYSRRAKLFVRIAIFALFVLQSLAIAFYLLRRALMTAMSDSQPFMSESILTRTVIAFGMLILIGVVCVGWIVPSQQLPNQRSHSAKGDPRIDWGLAALILLRIIASALLIGFACAITFGGFIFALFFGSCSGKIPPNVGVPILIVVIGAWTVSTVLIALIWIFGWKRR